MDIIKSATAGTMESSDAYVEIEPGNGKNEISVESVVWMQFGEKIRTAVEEVLNELEVENAKVRVVDRGALECVIRARVETAVLRGKGEK
ncbi:MAG: citrate lyase acyl carrier protein [Clostridia bacterium]|nr:citrate lyase acyl carrier protein [Clostridia bacterium]